MREGGKEESREKNNEKEKVIKEKIACEELVREREWGERK